MQYDISRDSRGISISEWLYVNTRLIWATQREVEPEFLHARYTTGNQIIAWLVKHGQITVETGGHTAAARKGEWMFPGTGDGTQIIRPGTIILSIRFSAEWPTGETLFDHGRATVFPAVQDRSLTRAADALESLVRRASRREGFFQLEQGTVTVKSYFAIRRAFEDWLSAYVGAMLRMDNQPSMMPKADGRVLQAARLIDDSPPDATLRESTLAHKTGLSVSQLNRLFLHDLGISPKKYMERRRLQEAVLLLQYHRKSIKEVAFELGFSSLPHFSAWFSRHQGMSPRAFQKQEI